MSVIKEVREFFLRHTKQNIGSKKDREYNYPLRYDVTIGGVIVSVYNRFIKGDYPSQGIFEKLFNSITFKLNVEDTAKTTEQGLVKKATLAQIVARTDNDSGYTLGVTPAQLPQVTGSTGITVVASQTATNVLYTISSSSSSQNVLVNATTCEIITDSGVTVTGGTTQDIITKKIGEASLGLANSNPATVLSLFD